MYVSRDFWLQIPYEHSRRHTAKRATEAGGSLSSLSLWRSRPIGNSSMRIASRRYPTGRSGEDHPAPPLRGMSASVGGTGRLRGFRGGTPAPRMCWGTRTPPLQEAAPHARPGCGVPGPRVSGRSEEGWCYCEGVGSRRHIRRRPRPPPAGTGRSFTRVAPAPEGAGRWGRALGV